MNHQRSKRRIFRVVVAHIAVFGVGFTIAKLTTWGYFVLNREISVLDAISIFVTLGVAMYITNVLEKDRQDNRSEKDLLLKRVDEINDKINTYSAAIAVTIVPLSDCISGIQRIKTAIKYVYKSLELLEMQINDDVLKNSYIETTQEIRKLLTYTPIKSDGIEGSVNQDISIRENMVHLSGKRVNVVLEALEDLKNKVLLLQVEINRS